jgi:hypothetical protein
VQNVGGEDVVSEVLETVPIPVAVEPHE